MPRPPGGGWLPGPVSGRVRHYLCGLPVVILAFGFVRRFRPQLLMTGDRSLLPAGSLTLT